jgi:hypothetical protein
MESLGRSLWFGATCLLLLTFASGDAVAQAKATCSFTLFTLPDSIPKDDFVLGVNSYSTAVGAFENVDHTEDAFLRYSGGDLNFFAPGSQPTWFTARNDLGNSVGVEDTVPNPVSFMLHGSSGVTYIIHPKAVKGTFAQGVNRHNSVVGYYLDVNDVPHGFKQLSNGSFVGIDYPNAQGTTPLGINDNGVIVGAYVDLNGSHGFIYANGKWATLEYPKVRLGTTILSGISNANTIIGFNSSTSQGTAFLYKNGVFKVIADSKASGGTYANGIAANGLIAGDVYLTYNKSSQHGFIATCQ